MDVHLDGAAAADDDQRVAEGSELALEHRGVGAVALDEEARAVAVAGRLEMHGLERHALEVGRYPGSGSPRAQPAIPRTISSEPGAARVDDARRHGAPASWSRVRASATSPGLDDPR